MLVIPLESGGKRPAFKGVSWKDLVRDEDDPEVRGWLAKGLNTGTPTGQPNGIVVRDFDGPAGIEIARAEFGSKKFCEFYKCLIRTPNDGLHLYLKAPEFPVPNSVRVDGRSVDLRADGAYVVSIGSKIRGRVYQAVSPEFAFRSVEELPVFPEEWLPRKEVQNQATEQVNAAVDSDRRIVRAKAYGVHIVCIPGNGTASKNLYRFCCWMRDVARLTKVEALAVLIDWNQTNCFREDGVTPYPWSMQELTHKLDSVFK